MDASPPPRARQLRVLTLNVWGLAHISPHRVHRLSHIADRVASGSWDIVCLQELWVESQDWQYLRRRCAAVEGGLVHSNFFYSGAFGSGLAVLSRWPVVGQLTWGYSLNGVPVHVAHGDWFVGKAAGCVTLRVDLPPQGPASPPVSFLLDVYNTHTVAAGGEEGPEKLRAHRLVQAWELARLVQNSAERGRNVLALGDFNATPPNLSISILKHRGALKDAFLDTHPGLSANAVSLLAPSREEPGSAGGPRRRTGSAGAAAADPDPHRAIEELGVTCDSPLNTWSKGKKLDSRARAGAGKRLDYVFYRNGDGEGSRVTLTPRECRVCFTERIPAPPARIRGRGNATAGEGMSYTDHFGVEALFDVGVVTDSGSGSEGAPSPSPATPPPERHLPQTLTSTISALESYLAHSSATQRTHLALFALCVTLALALCIAAPFAGYHPAGSASAGRWNVWLGLAVLGGVLAGFGGTTMLYSGVVWGEWEKRALRTAIEGMRLDLALVDKSGGGGSASATYANGVPSPSVGAARGAREGLLI